MTLAEIVFAGLWLFSIAVWMTSLRIIKQWVTVALKVYAKSHGLIGDPNND